MRRPDDDDATTWAEQDEWHRETEEFGLAEGDALTDALADDDGWVRFVAQRIAAEFLADTEAKRRALTAEERDRLVAARLEEMRR
jgi:hypothetical protein